MRGRRFQKEPGHATQPVQALLLFFLPGTINAAFSPYLFMLSRSRCHLSRDTIQRQLACHYLWRAMRTTCASLL